MYLVCRSGRGTHSSIDKAIKAVTFHNLQIQETECGVEVEMSSMFDAYSGRVLRTNTGWEALLKAKVNAYDRLERLNQDL